MLIQERISEEKNRANLLTGTPHFLGTKFLYESNNQTFKFTLVLTLRKCRGYRLNDSPCIPLSIYSVSYAEIFSKWPWENSKLAW